MKLWIILIQPIDDIAQMTAFVIVVLSFVNFKKRISRWAKEIWTIEKALPFK